jgi:hypothetical protein
MRMRMMMTMMSEIAVTHDEIRGKLGGGKHMFCLG